MIRRYSHQSSKRISVWKAREHPRDCSGDKSLSMNTCFTRLQTATKFLRYLNPLLERSLSLRQYERRFATEIGITPRLFARMIRFQVALDAKRMSPERSW